MNSSKTPTLSTTYPPHFNLIKSMACGLALLASGQAMARTDYFSATNITGADLTSPTNWRTGNACGGSTTPATINLTNADGLIICGHSLTLAATNTVAAWYLGFSGTGATLSGTLKFDSNNKTIVIAAAGSVAITTLDLSSMALGNTIDIQLIAPGDAISFTNVTGRSLECPSGTAYVAGTAITTNKTCTVVAAAAPPPINAPIDLHFSKQVESYSTEIELK